MANLSEEQLKSLNKEALIIIVSALQSQLDAMQSQLDSANAMLSENNKQINLLTEQIRIMNQRQFGRKSKSDLNPYFPLFFRLKVPLHVEFYQCLKYGS